MKTIFRHTCYLVFGCMLAFFNVACQTVQQKESVQVISLIENSSVVELEAEAALTRWEADLQLHDLVHANALYRDLYHERPDDINFQWGYYFTSIVLSSLGIGPSWEENNALFSKLSPAAKSNLASPGRLAYLDGLKAEEDNEALVSHLKKAIEQHPLDGFSWYHYSMIMEDNKSHWFSVALAKQAYLLNSESEEYAFQVADALNDVIQSSECIYEQEELSKKAASYYTKAAFLNPQEQVYIDNIALQYLRLGVIPIAYAKSKEAFEMSPNAWNADHYAVSSLLLRKYDEAGYAANALLNDMNDVSAFGTHAMLAASKGEWNGAVAHYEQFMSNSAASFYESLVYLWLLGISGAQAGLDFQSVAASTEWEKSILHFLSDADAHPNVLVDLASDRCEKTEAHFYTAMKHWFLGDESAVKSHLTHAVEYRNTLFIEYMWATILLRQGF